MEEHTTDAGDVPLATNDNVKAAQQDAGGNEPADVFPVDFTYQTDVSYALENYAVITNETDSFIEISSRDPEIPNLVIPPFGSRTLDRNGPDKYDLIGWAEQKLISVSYPEIYGGGTSAVLVGGFLMIALILFLLISIPANLIFHTISWRAIGIVSLILVISIVVSFAVSERQSRPKGDGTKSKSNIWGWLKLMPGMLLILATGLGLPVGIVYFFGDGRPLLEGAPQLASLGRLAQVSFIAVAAILPALFFYLFGRQQVDIQKNKFYKEVMSLDPNVHSLTETRTKYEDLIDSVYGSGTMPLSILLLFISTALLVMGWIISMGTLDHTADQIKTLADFFQPERTTFTFGFLGAYFFTINMVFRRFVRADLTPKTYAHITVRLLITNILVWVVSNLPQFQEGTLLESGLFALAFIIGFIPETGLTVIQDYVKKLSNIGDKDKDILSLSELEGVHIYDRARLLEEGIENIENLAHHNMIELIARTRIPMPRLVDMFDQAILYLHMGLEAEENKQFLATLKGHGIRTATDLDVALGDPSASLSLKNITPAMPLDRMDVIMRAFLDDDWYDHIVQWRLANRQRKDVIKDPYYFSSHAEQANPPGNAAAAIIAPAT